MLANILLDTLCWQSKYELPRLTSHLQRRLVFWEHDLWDGKWNKFVEQGVGSHPFRRWSNHQKFWIFMDILLITAGCLDTYRFLIQFSTYYYILCHVLWYCSVESVETGYYIPFPIPSCCVIALYSQWNDISPCNYILRWWDGKNLLSWRAGSWVPVHWSITLLITLTTYGI